MLRFALPEYIEEDPSGSGLRRAGRRQFCPELSGRRGPRLTGKQFLPKRERDRPVVPTDATLIEIASAMTRQHSPMVAVVDSDEILGVITVHRLLGATLPRS